MCRAHTTQVTGSQKNLRGTACCNLYMHAQTIDSSEQSRIVAELQPGCTDHRQLFLLFGSSIALNGIRKPPETIIHKVWQLHYSRGRHMQVVHSQYPLGLTMHDHGIKMTMHTQIKENAFLEWREIV